MERYSPANTNLRKLWSYPVTIWAGNTNETKMDRRGLRPVCVWIMADQVETIPMPPEVLRLRGDAAVALLRILAEEYSAKAAQITDFLNNLDTLDKSYGMEALTGQGGTENLLATVRKAMPHLAHLSDDILIKTFGKK